MTISSACEKSAFPSLEHIETNSSFPLPLNYANYRQAKHPEEFHKTTELYEHFDSIEGTHRADRLAECRSWAWFFRHKETGDIRVASNACRLRWCPICSESKSMFIREQVSDYIKSTDNAKMLTLTLQHSDAPLHFQIRSIYNFFRKFRKLKYVRENTQGGIWFFQCKISKNTGQWHPHFHCVIDSEFMPQAYLSQLWLKVTGSSSVLDIRKIRAPLKAADEVSRYISRPAVLLDYSLSETADLYSAFRGLRLGGTWGTGRSVSLTVPVSSDKSDWERVCRWSDAIEQYDNSDGARKLIKAWKSNKPIVGYLFIPSRRKSDPNYIEDSIRETDFTTLIMEPP